MSKRTYAQGTSVEECREQIVDERWRSLALLIKAKLAAVEAGITTAEDEFLAQTVVPTADGVATVSEVMQPQIREAYQHGLVPAGIMLALGSGN